jgi:hypothetical protein
MITAIFAVLTASQVPPAGHDQAAGQLPGFGTLRLDANPEKTGVTIYDEYGDAIAGASRLNKRIVHNDHGGPRRIPRTIRATWRTGNYYITREGAWEGGTITGEYTATVAERIPQEVFDYMRKNGGSLRLKIRLVDGAVLVGWDVAKYVPVEGWKPGDGDSGMHYYMAGGDFREDRVFNGKVVEPGWERVPPAGTTTSGK